MLFEGSEKKLEVIMADSAPRLRGLGRAFWNSLVQASQAQIISEISSESCDAYLLSESSLFVWDDHFTMITCGQTTLVSAAELFFSHISNEHLAALIFERKNEYFPRHQKTDFYDDVQKLSSIIPSQAFRFGSADEHHLFLLQSERPHSPSPGDQTLEILMYNLQGAARDIFSQMGASVKDIRQKTGVDQIFEGFQIDDFAFDPCGYSLNALRGSDYYTIHVTPEEQGSYVSFETNVNIEGEGVKQLVQRVLEVFLPRSFDIIAFQPRGENWVSPELVIDGFFNKFTVRDTVCGYDVLFSHHFKKIQECRPATPIGDLG